MDVNLSIVSYGWRTQHDFYPDFPQIYNLQKLMLDAKDQSQSVDLSRQNT